MIELLGRLRQAGRGMGEIVYPRNSVAYKWFAV